VWREHITYASFGIENRNIVDENKIDKWQKVKNRVEMKCSWLKRNREEIMKYKKMVE